MENAESQIIKWRQNKTFYYYERNIIFNQQIYQDFST